MGLMPAFAIREESAPPVTRAPDRPNRTTGGSPPRWRTGAAPGGSSTNIAGCRRWRRPATGAGSARVFAVEGEIATSIEAATGLWRDRRRRRGVLGDRHWWPPDPGRIPISPRVGRRWRARLGTPGARAEGAYPCRDPVDRPAAQIVHNRRAGPFGYHGARPMAREPPELFAQIVADTRSPSDPAN